MRLAQDLTDHTLPTLLLTLSSQDIKFLERELVLKKTFNIRNHPMNLFVRVSPMPFISFTSKNRVTPQAPYDVYCQEFPGKPSLLSLAFSSVGIEILLRDKSLSLEFQTNNGYRDLVVNYLPYS